MAFLRKSITAPAVHRKAGRDDQEEANDQGYWHVGTTCVIGGGTFWSTHPPNRLQTSAARLTALFILIHRVSVRMAPSSPSNPIAAKVTQPIVCWEVGPAAGGP